MAQVHYKLIDYGSTNYVFSMGKHRYVEPHIHREMELGLVLEGGTHVFMHEQDLLAQAGEMWLTNTAECHEFMAAMPRRSFVFLELQVSAAFFRPYFPQIDHLRFKQKVLRPSEIGEANYSMLQERLIDSAYHYFSASPWYELRCAGNIDRMLECLLRSVDHELLTDEEVLAQDARFRRMQRIADHIDEHLGEKLLLGDVAEQEGITLNCLSHFVRDSFGMPFQEVVQRKRCQKAAALLRDTEESPTEISLICGFSALKYMNQGFMKLVGCTPAEYRQKAHAGWEAEAQQLALLSAPDLEAARAEGGARTSVPHFSNARSLRYLERHGWLGAAGASEIKEIQETQMRKP